MEFTKENSNKKRLGRGLGSLLGGAINEAGDSFGVNKPSPAQSTTASAEAESQGSENRVWSIAIDKLSPGTYQPRKNFEKESLNELANSIRENGIIQPITV